MISSLVDLLFRGLALVIIVYVILSYFLSPYHPIRATLIRIIEPLLFPIRKIVPAVGGLDFSPLILLIAVQLIGQVLVRLLLSFGL